VAETSLRGPHVFGWGFNQPAAIASDARHAWVASDGINVWVANADQSVTGFPGSWHETSGLRCPGLTLGSVDPGQGPCWKSADG
jgi:hypothetical protein